MKWRKLSQIFCPDNNYPWMINYAAVPIAYNIDNDIFRIYFSSRDKNNRSYTCFVVLDINNPSDIIDISNYPILSPGEIGCFDDSGSMATSMQRINDKLFLYYIGWNLGVTVPFRNSIGLAISEDNGITFEKAFKGPVLDRTKDEPYFVASNCVLFDNSIYKMWYLSCVKWNMINDKPVHYYHIKYSESTDGINWDRCGIIAIDFLYENEYAISVPRVIKEDNIYKMWYSYRGGFLSDNYRIGYAESKNGIEWTRKDDEIGIDISSGGWDSEMICYPFVFDHKGKRYMLYNGNGYGKTGFGLAVLEEG